MKNRKKKSKRWWLKLIKQQRLANLYYSRKEALDEAYENGKDAEKRSAE